MELPPDYVILKFNQYNGGVKHNKSSNTYQGSCYICKEGDSWLKKKRCYYLVNEDIIYCHNCGFSAKPLTWVKKVTGDTFNEIKSEAEEFDLIPFESKNSKDSEIVKKIPTLPYDSINLFDPLQVNHFKSNPIVQKTLDLIHRRRIDTAINRPKTLWLSLKDMTHKNRLIIPFYDDNGDILFYQSRTVIELDSRVPRYLCKKHSDKSLYGLDSIDSNEDSVFIFEGPINAFFTKNSTATCGIQDNSDKTFTPTQQAQLNRFKFLRKIWVLDSQWIDNASYKKTQRLIDQGESVFIWPENIGLKFKDFNDICIYTKKDEVGKNFILENTHSGLMAKLKMSELTRYHRSNTPAVSG